jgi:hypothetical protein
VDEAFVEDYVDPAKGGTFCVQQLVDQTAASNLR